ncbi:3,4-dihydroxy-2-butanone-4-phosphate synthase [Bacillus sp. EB600]|uniref:3,4-dihydroxy-2-butanone-4-phosphate synthase n=1 Tax=Bacillus sp. EB600 TaxID=2806345 RepID=UPI00210A6AB1|nr:3,4-dihydroxy-2-butanone-4-phosphate synthase [Bacillus sp. EB600]MCQ6279537.1 3,4-dihydroxy-2-butanone-4-phosphate synthase [Bacillus sp. EB600]
MRVVSAPKLAVSQFKDGELIIMYDDLKTNIGTLIGLGEHVTSEKINLMTKVGKGLIYVCITEERAEHLEIPKMNKNHDHEDRKPFGVSVDFKDSTTGISSFERSDTVKAMTSDQVEANDFKRPGHIFPLISKKNGLLQRIDLTEAVVDLTKIVSDNHVGYMSEILNVNGEIASKDEIEEISELYRLPIIDLSEILKMRNDQEICSFRGMVMYGRGIGKSLGFPTANLDLYEQNLNLLPGVYGVKIHFNNQEFTGVMNVGYRPTFNENKNSMHYEVHIFDFNQDLYGHNIDIKVCFFLREEIAFPSIMELVNQINIDSDLAKSRFTLLFS